MKRAIARGVGFLAVGALGVGWTIARRLTAPAGPRTFDLTIHDIEKGDDGVRQSRAVLEHQIDADGFGRDGNSPPASPSPAAPRP